jgi:hypothetical protein
LETWLSAPHRPQATAENGGRQPFVNRGLAAVTLILLLAFPLSSAFVTLFIVIPNSFVVTDRHRGGFSTAALAI